MASDNKAKILRDAEKYVLQGKIPQAINEYLKIVKNDPSDVLTLNTVGDLYLRQGKVLEANKYFSDVAESYTRNNFLLKAIAVYKKILGADPENLEINLILASLYARQGLNVDARNQYMRLADLYAKDAKPRESLEAYEKVITLDPTNIPIQMKLAENYLVEGLNERALVYFAGAARAQAKGGDLQGALVSYKRAIGLNPADTETMKGFLETSIQLGDVSAAMDQLKKSVDMVPEDVSLREMLGQAYLAANDPDKAAKTFQQVFSLDESRYRYFFSVSEAFLKAGDYDQAVKSLDVILPTLISRRETERAIETYSAILSANPEHVLSLIKLADLFSATNDQLRYLETLDQVATYYLSRQSPEEALKYFDAILQIAPESEKHLKLHRQAFAEAFPGAPYSAPAPSVETRPGGIDPSLRAGEAALALQGVGEESAQSSLVEIDLLINYGMKEKALGLLLSLEARDPTDKEVRMRLLTLYRDGRENEKAAEQCLALASLHRKANNEEAAAKFLGEARKLAPELADSRLNLVEFAHQRGIPMDSSSIFEEAPKAEAVGSIEVDLSGDLSEIFFKDGTEPPTLEESEEAHLRAESIIEDYAEQTPQRLPSDLVQEQLQEVDFYIRLGFYGEARSKLDEIAREFPDNPELPLRYRQLEEGSSQQSDRTAGSDQHDAGMPVETAPPDEGDFFQELKISPAGKNYSSQLGVQKQAEADSFKAQSAGEAFDGTGRPRRDGAESREERSSQVRVEGKVNSMFADLIEEVNSLTDQELAREDFETHFNLGIAYREMDLIEDAIKEFQGAVKMLNPSRSPREIIQCCGMLSTCFLEKGMPRSAIRWCQTGLSVAEVSPHEAMALRYDMGIALSLTGESNQALECFGFIFGIDPSYRDVAQRIDALRGHS